MCLCDKLKCISIFLAKALPIVITIASIFTATVPNPSPQTAEAIQVLHKLADVIALNVANNTPRDTIGD